jgi:hypothetical protein
VQGDQKTVRWRASFFDGLAHYVGQVFYVIMEGFGHVFRRGRFVDEQRAVRRAAHLYWIAKALRRAGKPGEAFAKAREAFACLDKSDKESTFVQIGILIAGLLAELAEELGDPAAADSELRQVLAVLKEMQATPPSSPHLDGLVNWIERRLAETPRAPVAQS